MDRNLDMASGWCALILATLMGWCALLLGFSSDPYTAFVPLVMFVAMAWVAVVCFREAR